MATLWWLLGVIEFAVLANGQPAWFSECVGYGCGVTESYPHTSCVVNELTLEELQRCLSSESVHVTFAVSGKLELTSAIKAPRGTILDGSGNDVTFTGHDLFLEYDSIVYRITFDTGFEDAITVRGDWVSPMGNIWIHRCTFTNYMDGLVDITRGMTRITVSWCFFHNHNKTMLISQDMEDTDTDQITVHHNFFFAVIQRHPRVRYAHCHVYNNVYEQIEQYAIASSMRGRVFVENNVFLPSTIANYECTRVEPLGPDTENGFLRQEGNVFYEGCSVKDYLPENVDDAPYTYELDVADDDLVARVKAGAGNN